MKQGLLIVGMCLGLFGAIVGFPVGNPGFGALGEVAVAVGTVKLCMTRQE